MRDGHPRGQSPEECRLNNCSSGYQTDILHSSSESIQAINECSNSPSTLEQVTGDLNNGCFTPVITESDVAALTDYGSQKHLMFFGSDATAKVVTEVPLFIIEDQTYPVDVIIPAPDELRFNCIPEWCDTLLRNMTSDLHKLRLIIQMVTAVFSEMLDMDNAQPVETTPMLQCVSYPLMEDMCQIKCIKPPQEHLIDISQEDQWMRHTPTGLNLVKDEQLDNTQYLYIATLCLSISYRQVKNDGKHCDQEMSNSHHLISDHLKIDFALSNIPDVSHQNMTYSCWWSKVDQNRITKLVTRRYVSDHIRMDYAPGNKPQIFQESINLHDVVHIESYVHVCGCPISTKDLFHLLQPMKCTTLHLKVVLLISQSITLRAELITELTIIQESTNDLMRFLNRECTIISTSEVWVWTLMKTDVLVRIPSSTGVNISRLKNYNLRCIDYAIYLCSELGERSSVGHRTGVPFAQCH